MELTFTGKVSEVRKARTGTGAKGEWANVEFEVTELSPQNESYPQVALFDFFKNGEYIKFAKDFETYNPIGTELIVHFNFKKTEYTKKDGTAGKFYKTSAWKVEKLETAPSIPQAPIELMKQDDEPDDLPF